MQTFGFSSWGGFYLSNPTWLKRRHFGEKQGLDWLVPFFQCHLQGGGFVSLPFGAAVLGLQSPSSAVPFPALDGCGKHREVLVVVLAIFTSGSFIISLLHLADLCASPSHPNLEKDQRCQVCSRAWGGSRPHLATC